MPLISNIPDLFITIIFELYFIGFWLLLWNHLSASKRRQLPKVVPTLVDVHRLNQTVAIIVIIAVVFSFAFNSPSP